MTSEPPERRTVGLLHPGEMGAAVGAALRAAGHEVLWVADGRSAATWARAEQAGLDDAGTLDELAGRSDVVLSICPPAFALDVARALPDFSGRFVDANAVSPATARAVGAEIERRGGSFVDGGIVGPPPRADTTRLYLSGSRADEIATLFGATVVDARVVSAEIGAASALKMAYAAWTKGTAALLLAARAVARAEGVERELDAEWQLSAADLPARLGGAAAAASTKGWRWIDEMEQIADTFATSGLPDGFHRAAAEVYRRVSRTEHPDAGTVERVLDELLDAGPLSPASDGPAS